MRGDDDPRYETEKPGDERGRHNRIGYLNVDETESSSEAGAEEPEIGEDVDQPDE